jgi:hypothetical protein
VARKGRKLCPNAWDKRFGGSAKPPPIWIAKPGKSSRMRRKSYDPKDCEKLEPLLDSRTRYCSRTRSGATFSSQGDQPALSAGRADIKGSVFLDAGLTAQGVVDFTEATIGSNLDCRGGHLVGIGYQSALSANRAHINGSVLLGQGFTAQGEVELVSTTIGSLLECIGGHFVGRFGQPALSMNDAEIQGIVLLKDGFTAQGEVDLTRATIGSNLECTGGQFIGLGDESALSINRSDIKGSVFMNTRFSSQGEVDLVGATIGFNLDCGGGLFIGTEKSVALNAKGTKIQGTVFLDRDLETKGNFSADGGIVLASAAIGGDLDFDGCRLTSKWERLALDAQSVKIDGSVSCSNKTTVSGGVRFSFATITRDFQWTPFQVEQACPHRPPTRKGRFNPNENRWVPIGRGY